MIEAISGKNVVVTGIVPGHSRGTAQAFLQEAGAYVQPTMSSTTEVLVVGGKPGPKKLVKARELGIEVITWEEMVKGRASGNGHGQRVEAASARVVAPQLALAGDLPKGDDWLFEVKWDGYRCVATVSDGKVAMQSRSGRSEYVEQFPRVAEALAELPDCILDGELIVMSNEGVTNFETVHTGAAGMEAFIVFDTLEVDGADVRRAALWQRREAIKALLGGDEHGPIRISPAHDDGTWLYAWVVEQGMEGVVAKRKSSRYVEGSRTEAWIKTKVRLEQEFVVLGWKPGEGTKSGAAGSLLLGVRVGDPKLPPIWKACGRVGTGRDYAYWQQFTELEPASPGIDYDLGNASNADLKGVEWVEPTCVVQVQFQRWTKDGRLWHPALLHVRDDKDALDVVRET